MMIDDDDDDDDDDAVNTYFIVFDAIQFAIERTIYRPSGEHRNQYAIEVA